MTGAGGTEGGIGRFLIGLAMFVVGGYLFLDSIWVGSGFGFGSALFGIGRFNVTTGMVLVPFVFGVVMLFYNAKNPISWLLTGGSLAALAFGVISRISLRLRPMSAFELITILVLCFGGLGLFLSSLRDLSSEKA